MRALRPTGEEIHDLELERRYKFGDGRWLAMNFVSSADGSVSVAGRSAGLSNAADQRVYRLSRDLSDIVLVGAGTAMQEQFQGVHPDKQTVERRRRHGLEPVPPVAVVTSGRSLPPDAPVLTNTLRPTLVLAPATTPGNLLRAWQETGAQTILAGEQTVDLPAALDELAARGLHRIGCDGGPELFGQLLTAGLVDELRLTITPLLVAGAAGRIATAADVSTTQLSLASALIDEDTLLLRYLVRREPPAHSCQKFAP